MANFPCKDCAARFPNCWSECEKYLAAKAENDRIKSARIGERDRAEYFVEGAVKQIIKKRKGR